MGFFCNELSLQQLSKSPNLVTLLPRLRLRQKLNNSNIKLWRCARGIFPAKSVYLCLLHWECRHTRKCLPITNLKLRVFMHCVKCYSYSKDSSMYSVNKFGDVSRVTLCNPIFTSLMFSFFDWVVATALAASLNHYGSNWSQWPLRAYLVGFNLYNVGTYSTRDALN